MQRSIIKTMTLAAVSLTLSCSALVDSDSRTGSWWVCPATKAATGLEHGQKCTQDSDCLYGHCVDGGFLTGYTAGIKYCTKNNNCGTAEATCAIDGDFVSMFERSKSGGNTSRTNDEPHKVCAKACSTDAECAAWNPEMPDCIKNSTDFVSVGVNGGCGVNPFQK